MMARGASYVNDNTINAGHRKRLRSTLPTVGGMVQLIIFNMGS